MHPKHTSIFPYKNRAFAQELKVLDSDHSNNELLTLIFLSNLKKGDQLAFNEKAHVEVVGVENGVVDYLVKVTGSEDSPYQATLETAFTTLLGEAILDKFENNEIKYDTAYSNILERDPAVFRKSDKQGWLINDLLALSVGGAQCRSHDDIQTLNMQFQGRPEVIAQECEGANAKPKDESESVQYSLF